MLKYQSMAPIINERSMHTVFHKILSKSIHSIIFMHLSSGVLRVYGVLVGDAKWRPFPSCIRLASVEGAPLAIQGSRAEPQPPTFLGAFGCEWNPFWIAVNTIFNLACQTGKRQRRYPSLKLRSLGRRPSANAFGAYGCKWNPFLKSVNTIFNSLGAHCEPAACGLIVIVPFGNLRRGAFRQWYWRHRLTHV